MEFRDEDRKAQNIEEEKNVKKSQKIPFGQKLISNQNLSSKFSNCDKTGQQQKYTLSEDR